VRPTGGGRQKTGAGGAIGGESHIQEEKSEITMLLSPKTNTTARFRTNKEVRTTAKKLGRLSKKNRKKGEKGTGHRKRHLTP